MKNRNSPTQKTVHHIIPKSRIKGKGVTGVCRVPRSKHERYHGLFGNMTPFEILQYLNEEFWHGEYEMIITRI